MVRPPLRLLIDTDPGVDDAIALLMALGHHTATVEAITVVAGNVGLDQTVRNARYLVELCGADTPVYAGATRALLRDHQRAEHVHGDDGLGQLGLRPRDGRPAPGHAVSAIIDRLTANPGAITVVTLGPLTNLALALRQQPAIAALARDVIVMGGAANTVGNVTPAAEFNMWSDPEAADIVFAAGWPLTLVPLEICRAARWTAADVATLSALGTERARVAAALLGTSLAVDARRAQPGDPPGAMCPDGTAMAVALDPTVVTAAGRYFVAVETRGELTVGETVVDRRGVLGRPPNVTVVHAIATAGFHTLVRQAVA